MTYHPASPSCVLLSPCTAGLGVTAAAGIEPGGGAEGGRQEGGGRERRWGGQGQTGRSTPEGDEGGHGIRRDDSGSGKFIALPI